MTRLTVFSKDGYWIGDIRTNATYEFVKNAYPTPGRCNFSVSTSDTKCSLRYLEFGNYILIRDPKLPDWIGEITKRTWNYGSVDVEAMQAEYILSKRSTPIQKFTGTAGSIFVQTLELTNSATMNEKIIKANTIYYGGISRTDTAGNSGLQFVSTIANKADNDFEITYKFDGNGRLYLVGNWYEKIGLITNFTLREGRNIETSSGVLTEDTQDQANWIEGRGDADTAGTRITTTFYDVTSIARYGLNQKSKVFDGNKEKTTLETNTMSELKNVLDPSQAIDVTAIDADNTFYNLAIGNVLEFDLNKSGFADGGGLGLNVLAEIVGMSIDTMGRKCRIIAEKYNNATV